MNWLRWAVGSKGYELVCVAAGDDVDRAVDGTRTEDERLRVPRVLLAVQEQQVLAVRRDPVVDRAHEVLAPASARGMDGGRSSCGRCAAEVKCSHGWSAGSWMIG